MRLLLPLLLPLLCATAVAADRAFVEMDTPRDGVFVHEPIRLQLRIGFDRDFFRTNAVPLFRRPMDVPVQVTAPWLESLEGTKLLSAPRGVAVPTFALNDDVVACTRTEQVERGGRTFTVLVVERVYRPASPGEITIPAPRLRYAFGTVFEEDFINGRRAVDRREAFADGRPLKILVRPLPEKGRPPEFSDAVGRFTVRAQAAPRELDAGESLKLTLHIEGTGNLDALECPAIDGLPGFHVFGAIEDRGPACVTVRYDLAPLDGSVTKVPAIPFAFFDPAPPAAYRVVKTAPIPLAVRGSTGVETDSENPETSSGTTSVPLLALVAVAVVGAIGILLRMRIARRDRPDPARERAEAAVEAFRARIDGPDADVADALAEFLAAHLRCGSAAVIAPGLDARLIAAGVPGDLAARTAALLESLVGTRYGGRASVEDGEAARAIVDELHSVFVDALA